MRSPKPADVAPVVYARGRGGTAASGGRRVRSASPGAGPSAPRPDEDGWSATDDTGEERTLEEVREAPGREIEELTRRIVARLSVRPKRDGQRSGAGNGALRPVRYRYNADDIDLDRTLEVLTGQPFPEDTDIVVRDRVRAQRAVTLMVDVSGSMRGEKVRVAAATVGALAAELRDEDLSVVAFWKDAALVQASGTARPPQTVVEDLLRIPARGLTNVAFGLEAGLAQLRVARARDRIGILLSDVVHNAGPDPRAVAARFPGGLHVLLQTDGQHDEDLATELARIGRGRLARVEDHRDVAPALNRMLDR